MNKKLFRWIKGNSLSLAFLLLFLASIAGQALLGWKEYNKERAELKAPALTLTAYFSSGHFIESTFENWESEFLQMALFVILTIFLTQKGSSESKDPDKDEEVDREPDPSKKDAPWPVRRGGIALTLYKYSLTISLLLLFLISFAAHFYGSLKDEQEQQRLSGETLTTATGYIQGPRFWFESFQNWQSEFLSVFVLVVFSIYLRQKGSPQSKPVDAPNSETGE
jgi:glycerol uptake facilitator-like aquaporin